MRVSSQAIESPPVQALIHLSFNDEIVNRTLGPRLEVASSPPGILTQVQVLVETIASWVGREVGDLMFHCYLFTFHTHVMVVPIY